MKRTAIFTFLVLFSLMAVSQYITPDTGVSWNLDDLVQNSSGIVTFEDDSYYLWDDITISESDTILIYSDGILHISAGKLITVEGTLKVNPPANFIFTAVDTTQNYLGFRFENSGYSHLANCTVEFGGGIKLIGSDMTIDNCIIRKNDKSYSSGAIDLFQSNPLIKNCTIYENEGPAIQSAANAASSAEISQNTIYHNNTANENMPQINMGTTAEGEELKIFDNNIEGYYDNAGGIAVSTLAGGSVLCRIEGNVIKNNRYGIAVYGNNISSVITGNTISDNNIQNDPMLGGSGINFWGDTTNVSIVSENDISGNLWGITIMNKAKPNLGQVEDDTVNVGRNLIYDNGNEGTVYALYNNTPGNIFAENNYWGTYDIDTVEMYIFHQPDDPSLGFVDYLPIKDYLTGEKENTDKRNIGLIKSFYPNPVKNTGIIVFNTSTSGKMKKVEIFNIFGKRLFYVKTKKDILSLNTSGITEGFYMIRVQTGKTFDFYNFLKQ